MTDFLNIFTSAYGEFRGKKLKQNSESQNIFDLLNILLA